MKKILSTFGVIATATAPLLTTISCAPSDQKYFYEIIIEPINIEKRSLEVFIFHLPTETNDEINDDFREEYWRRLYGDLAKSLYEIRKTLVVDRLKIVYSSIDHNDDGGKSSWAIDLTDAEKFPFAPYTTIPEHIAQPGEKIYVTDENGLETLVDATVETSVPERLFYLQTLQQLFSDNLLNFVDKDSLLFTTPSGDTIEPERWSTYGFLLRNLFRDHLEKI